MADQVWVTPESLEMLQRNLTLSPELMAKIRAMRIGQWADQGDECQL